MKRKRTSVASTDHPLRVVLVTLDNHVSGAWSRAADTLSKQVPALYVSAHAATEWDRDPAALNSTLSAIAEGDIVIVTMLFLEAHIEAVRAALADRCEACDAMICCMSAPEIMRLTRMGRFRMDTEATGALALLKRMRGGGDKTGRSAGAQQMTMLRRLPRLLRFIPGTAQDVRAYFLTLQYWLAGSETNLARMMAFLINRYAGDAHASTRDALTYEPPIEYPDTGLYHKRLPDRITDDPKLLGKAGKKAITGTVGVLLMRSYALSGNSAHYDAVIESLEARGLRVIPAFAAGLDARPAVKAFFMDRGEPIVDAVVSLTGFSLVGGPAYNDTDAAQEMLEALDVPYLAVQGLEFQSLQDWESSSMGLMPVEATMMVAIPELDGATGSMVFGGRSELSAGEKFDMKPAPERIDRLADRVARLIALRYTPIAERKVAIVLFNFPPNSGAAGTAAHLSVFESLFNTLSAMRDEGYKVDLPDSHGELRDAILKGNAKQFGAEANVFQRVPVDDHVRAEPWLAEIEAQWGPAPGKEWTDGQHLFVLGESFGNVLVGIQPPMGYEGDPMRMLFEGGLAPTHVFSHFYRWLREDFGANAVLHFGTHGSLEFMPGKQVGLSDQCWPDRLIADLPNVYLYAANNPSEGLIAKRRAASTLISYLTPPVTHSDLYRHLVDLRAAIDHWRQRPAEIARDAEQAMIDIVLALAALCELCEEGVEWAPDQWAEKVAEVRNQLDEIEQALIPFGLHVVGEPLKLDDRLEMLLAMAESGGASNIDAAAFTHAVETENKPSLKAVLKDAMPNAAEDAPAALTETLVTAAAVLSEDHELRAILRALDGRFIQPVKGGDVLRAPEILPTGRNLHGFDPFRLPASFAHSEGCRQAAQLLARHQSESGALPESVALVLWGTDNLKTEGVSIAQALALLGAEPRQDSYGRVVGARLLPLEQLGRPRIDVLVTLSGIFRDLLPMQTQLLAEASWLAATADEDVEQNFVRKHVLAYQEEHGCDLEQAALRVFSNAEGAYGSNVNLMLDSGRWEDEEELADCYTQRKGFAYDRHGKVSQQSDLLNRVLEDVDLAYQNLDSVELGVTTVDHYFGTLGGISRAVQRARGERVPVYIADHTSGGTGRVRTLSEQVALEARTRLLNPKWYESMLDHGYEGVRQIEAHITNTMGWSATTGDVAPWVYKQLSETFVLDEDMRRRLAELNPVSAARLANRLIEAQEREYWGADDESIDALKRAGEDLEDFLEGVTGEVAA
ncbi:MAG: magnesium chelatase subunit H [Halieaceae bacterium]|nr:MAG: magnesium chelatase subunit H [Halieaceae bacterium]